MNRRNFLSLVGLGVAGIALEQAIPLGRVWSFPKKIVVPQTINLEVVAGAGFAWDGEVTVITRWFRDPPTGLIFKRCEILEADGNYKAFEDWGKTPFSRFPFVIQPVTAAFPPDSSHRPS